MNTLHASSLFNVSGLSVAITGGAGVLGSAMARTLLVNGATVTLIVRSPESAERARQSLADAGGTLHTQIADVTNKDSFATALHACKHQIGSLDALINSAGGNRPGATAMPDRPFWDLPAEDMRAVVDLNLMGTVIPCQIAGKIFAEQKSGNIINVSSMAAMRPLTRVVGYSASKSAVTNFTQWLSVHMCQAFGECIRVNAIAPGFFLTEQNRFLLTEAETGNLTARGKTILDHTPMGRFGQPDDLSGVLLWLLSPASRFVTGTVIPVDGGFSAFSGV